MVIDATLAHFYGWKPEYIDSLDNQMAMDYYMAITTIDARNTLTKLTVVDYPKMKQSDRKRVYKQIRDMAEEGMEKQELDYDEFVRRINV